jgi:hypothetical protein
MGIFLYILEVSDTTLSSQLGRRVVHSLVLPANWALVEDLLVAMADAMWSNGLSLYSTLLEVGSPHKSKYRQVEAGGDWFLASKYVCSLKDYNRRLAS